MEKPFGLKTDSPYVLVRCDAEIDQAFKKAVREALLKHKLAGNPIAVSRNGNVVILQPDEIMVD